MKRLFHMTFENAYGSIEFGGGDAPVYRTTEVTGLGPPQKEFNVVSYAGQAGQETIAEKDLPRVITLGGDLCRTEGVQEELSRMARVLYHPGELKIHSGSKKRKIACRCTAFDDPERRGPNVARFVVQFTADNPFFTDFEPREIPVFQRELLLEGSFTLPCMFSKRTSRQNIFNMGDVKTEPIFTIYSLDSDAETSAIDGETGIVVTNHTTGQHIQLECSTTPGEVITIDIPNRRVESSKNPDIITTLTGDSFLSNFWLAEGGNDVEVISYNTGETISVICRYDNQYVEAVY